MFTAGRSFAPALIAAFAVTFGLVSSFSVPPVDRTLSKTALGVSFSSHAADDMNENHHPNRRTEFSELEPVEHSQARKTRIRIDKQNRNKFAKYGDELWRLRKTMTTLSEKLVNAINNGVRETEEKIRESLREMEMQDPELVYELELEKMYKAKSEGRSSDAEVHSKKALAARSCLPHFNLEGLWVGKYGHHGYEMINITYHGDTLVGYKVTGDNNVPRGEITFQVDLSPITPRTVGADGGNALEDAPLQPIVLTEKAAKKWGTSQLPRYRGLGQVAEPGFTNNQWMDGQLIVIGDEYFSFAWVPIENQIFFGRPSPELALKMLRESKSAASLGTKTWDTPPSVDDDVTVLKDYISSCLEKTAQTLEEEFHGDPLSCIWHNAETEECYFE